MIKNQLDLFKTEKLKVETKDSKCNCSVCIRWRRQMRVAKLNKSSENTLKHQTI